jgi:anti-sigma regulatory factor (Ser/Thr protein kinase)
MARVAPEDKYAGLADPARLAKNFPDLDLVDRNLPDIAVREAVANAIKHGNQQNPAKQVHVDLMVENGELVIRVEDEGAGFDPGKVRDPLAPENLLSRNGRGILFMNKFMDSIHYGSKPDGGTVVTLRRRVPGPKTDILEQTDPEEGTE